MLSLALLRHAKSSWDATDIDDFDRALNERGRNAAPVMGAALKELQFAPERILCSPAKRTRETLALVQPFLKDGEVTFDEQLYLTSPDTILERLKAVPVGVSRVLVVGHNPGLHSLALMLAGTGDAKSISKLEDKFPTGALAVFSFPQVTWRDVAPASGHLEAFVTPRDRA
ncbi:histidine phosphatase family protein [Hyphomicrobium sp.]|uniref:SixA phosphatase family protein n=1 Tax=Hyphomicrobium sp. TaxID=82 RepID=UPI002D793690|nr:histidine phosphatase family protein [Hyphomicrobium sp.]HET6387865.1 histidine phosphatase family protein [Hyphomicrobium sp.]